MSSVTITHLLHSLSHDSFIASTVFFSVEISHDSLISVRQSVLVSGVLPCRHSNSLPPVGLSYYSASDSVTPGPLSSS